MRTNIDIDDALMDAAMRAGPFASKREAVAAGLQLLARKAAYRDILALRGQLQWDDEPLPTPAARATTASKVHSPPPPPYGKRAKGDARTATRKVSST
ncbi:MAG: type II toxin-antitoxin system VapB family antitoxin [Proteobacteria bacterium]|nr:type II toxin-antitoxin system VapB family antitoxin [Pseudomonadota bacterium]